MANVNKPTGLLPASFINGSDWDGRGNTYSIAASNATILSVGDPVSLTGTADASGKYPQIARTTPGSGLIGSILAIGTNPNGPYINSGDLSAVQKAASLVPVYYALVSDSPDIIYEIQEDGSGGALAITDVGLNANIVFANPATGVVVSAVQLANSTKATTATLDVKILRLVNRGDNALGTYAKWWVRICNHQLAAGSAGI